MTSTFRSAFSIVAVVAVSLIAVELALRLADLRVLRQDSSERSLAYDYDAGLGWKPAANSVSVVTTARTIHARPNSLGFRDIEYRPDGKSLDPFCGRLVCMGVDAETGEWFTDLLRERMIRYSILNAGVSGYGTDQEFISSRKTGPAFGLR
jgi:hypothetical protein